MSMKRRDFIPRALVVSGILFGALLANPASHAGQAVTLVPEDDRDVPEGSQIPQWRTHETEEKVREYKEKMRTKSPVQQQEQSPQDVSPEPKVEQP
jgi:hypothetical protein